MLLEDLYMRVSVLLLLLVVFAQPCYSQAPSPMPMISVEPDFGNAGETLDQSDGLLRFKITVAPETTASRRIQPGMKPFLG